MPQPIPSGLKSPPNHFDGPWKLAVENLFHSLLAMFFPDVAALVDRTRPARFLDGELQSIAPNGEAGGMRADKLVQVTWIDGTHAWLLVHVEVQAQRDPNLGARMFRYHYRIHDRFGQHPVGLVVLADDDPGWRPGPYVHEVGRSRLMLEYRTCKLLDIDLGPWLAAGNPVARVVEAHRVAQRTRGDVAGRWKAKLGLIQGMGGSGLGREDTIRVLRVIHGLLALPREEEVALRQELRRQEAGMHDTMRSPYEMVVLEEGRCAAAREMLFDILAARFGPCDAATTRALDEVGDPAELRRLAQCALRVPNLEDFVHEVHGGAHGGGL